MRICMIFEGSYPYVRGGVSSWAHEYIQSMPEHEFVLWTIAARLDQKGQFKYELPKNVVEVKEIFLDQSLQEGKDVYMPVHLTRAQMNGLTSLLAGRDFDWAAMITDFRKRKLPPAQILQSPSLMKVVKQLCKNDYPTMPFSNFFHMVRSLLLPIIQMMQSDIPEADCYHAISTGYGGLLGATASIVTKKPLALTEHGIYTREREEELIGAEWCAPEFRHNWINLFYSISHLVYEHSVCVTSLFHGAARTQQEHGCPAEKCMVIPNGVHTERLEHIPPKVPDGWTDIGAVVRFAPIKDIITLLYGFYELHCRVPNARLHILGGVDDGVYAEKCYSLARSLGLDKEHLIFTGFVNTAQYLEKLDVTVLTSLSEGQPLSVLESFAAGRPCVTTNVGCCAELLGTGDECCGLIVPPMNPDRLGEALEWMCLHPAERVKMGKLGKEKVLNHYRQAQMVDGYQAMYRKVMEYGRNRI